MKDVSKPALAGLWPSKKGMSVVLDLGANIECDEKNLVDFAEMGAALFKSIFPTIKPSVSLLNIGSEEIKGTETLKKVYSKLKSNKDENNFLFKGYIEGNKFTILQDGEFLCKELGLDFNEVYSRTNTSYKPYPSGNSDYKSASSVERVEAFIALGRPDPVTYEDESGVVNWEHVVTEVSKILAEHE